MPGRSSLCVDAAGSPGDDQKRSAAARAYTASERTALADAAATLGRTTFDIYLNENAFWRNVPAAVWTYKLGGYQVLKKWLSYRECGVLDRALTPNKVQRFTDIARRLAAILTTARNHPPYGEYGAVTGGMRLR